MRHVFIVWVILKRKLVKWERQPKNIWYFVLHNEELKNNFNIAIMHFKNEINKTKTLPTLLQNYYS